MFLLLLLGETNSIFKQNKLKIRQILRNFQVDPKISQHFNA